MSKREQFSYLSSLLYLVSVTFVIFKVFGDLEAATRMGVFWIILLFTAINIVGQSFDNNQSKRRLGHYQLYDPVEFLIAKITLNFGKLLMAGILLIGCFMLFSSKGLVDPKLFFACLLVAIFGLVIVLTLISSIGMYSGDKNSMVTVLALPLVIPILIIGMKVSLVSERMFFDSAADSNLLMLFGIDLVLLVASLVFISFTWKP